MPRWLRVHGGLDQSHRALRRDDPRHVKQPLEKEAFDVAAQFRESTVQPAFARSAQPARMQSYDVPDIRNWADVHANLPTRGRWMREQMWPLGGKRSGSSVDPPTKDRFFSSETILTHPAKGWFLHHH
jgi:hypothetical protein